MGLFQILALSVFLGLHLLSFGVIFYFFPSTLTRVMLWCAPVVGMALVVAGFALRGEDSVWQNILYLAGNYWLGILFIMFVVCMTMAFGEVFVNLLVRFKIIAAQVTWWIGRVGVLFIVLLCFLGIIGGQTPPVIKKINLKSNKLPVDSLRVVQISDTHLGVGVSIARVKEMVSQINKLEADIIVVTGDFFEHGSDATRKANADILKEMKAKYGVYGTLGNHEFYRGVAKNTKFFKDSNVTLLRSEIARPLPGVAVSGVDDISSAHIKKEDFSAFLNTLKPSDYNILLEHEPSCYSIARGKVDLMLGGHTHDGQIWPFRYLVKTRYPHYYGLKTDGGTVFYVTSGVFYWGPPMRLFSRNEIVLFNIEKE